MPKVNDEEMYNNIFNVFKVTREMSEPETIHMKYSYTKVKMFANVNPDLPNLSIECEAVYNNDGDMPAFVRKISERVEDDITTVKLKLFYQKSDDNFRERFAVAFGLGIITMIYLPKCIGKTTSNVCELFYFAQKLLELYYMMDNGAIMRRHSGVSEREVPEMIRSLYPEYNPDDSLYIPQERIAIIDNVLGAIFSGYPETPPEVNILGCEKRLMKHYLKTHKNDVYKQYSMNLEDGKNESLIVVRCLPNLSTIRGALHPVEGKHFYIMHSSLDEMKAWFVKKRKSGTQFERDLSDEIMSDADIGFFGQYNVTDEAKYDWIALRITRMIIAFELSHIALHVTADSKHIGSIQFSPKSDAEAAYLSLLFLLRREVLYIQYDEKKLENVCEIWFRLFRLVYNGNEWLDDVLVKDVCEKVRYDNGIQEY